MLKKVFLMGTAAALATGVACASSAPYIGASLGILNNTVNKNSTAFGNYRGMPVNVFVGYGALLSQSFYLAGELTGTLVTAELMNNGSMKSTYGYGASLLPGYMLGDTTLAFVRAGVVRTRYTSLNTTQTGGQFGFGMQTSLTQSVDLRSEYDFAPYRSITTASGISASPRADVFSVGLVYHFD
ncbi:MAG TPA: outer membrane beta-barrel protein [Gammaproteobacteria bacterium]|jgi:hypothetical protein|nr:outer membrane beta-barrel protein [Gammaproteobacteria bacterium]